MFSWRNKKNINNFYVLSGVMKNYNVRAVVRSYFYLFSCSFLYAYYSSQYEGISGEVVFLFLHKNICCGYSLEVPHRGTSNEYPQRMFLWRNKKNINTFWLKNMPYLELSLSRYKYFHSSIILGPSIINTYDCGRLIQYIGIVPADYEKTSLTVRKQIRQNTQFLLNSLFLL